MEDNVKATAEFIRSLGREDLKPMEAEEVEAERALYESCGVPCTVSR